MQAFFGIFGQLAVENAVSGCVRLLAVSALCHSRILCQGCVSLSGPIKARPVPASARQRLNTGIVASAGPVAVEPVNRACGLVIAVKSPPTLALLMSGRLPVTGRHRQGVAEMESERNGDPPFWGDRPRHAATHPRRADGGRPRLGGFFREQAQSRTGQFNPVVPVVDETSSNDPGHFRAISILFAEFDAPQAKQTDPTAH